MSRTGEMASTQRGFTLIEVVVVLAILALVTALALPLMSGAQSKADTQTAAREVAAGLRTTRDLAMMHGHAEAFSIDTASGAFRAGSTTSPRRIPRGVRLILITTTEDRIGETAGRIRFFPDGSSTGGGVQLSKGNSRNEVLVDWLTGRVSIGAGADAAAP